MPEEGVELMEKPSIMTLEEIIEISGVFQKMGVDTIRLTGGEPLLRKNFEFLARSLADMGLTLKLTTNGILIDKYLDLFKEIGLTKINVSLDTLDKAKAAFITKRDFFDRIMSNIDRALNSGMELKLNVVLIKGVNDHEIKDFIALTKHQRINVKFIEFMPFKGNKWDWSKGISEQAILEKVRSNFGPYRLLESAKHSTSTNYQVNDHLGTFGIISTITNPFCSDCNRIRLTADGKMKNCLFANSETDLLTPYRKNQPIENMISNAIQGKKYSRDGMDIKMEAHHYEKNRSMISIGG